MARRLTPSQVAAIKSKQGIPRIPRKCTLCGSTVSKSRAREQQGERFVEAPFCIECEREHG